MSVPRRNRTHSQVGRTSGRIMIVRFLLFVGVFLFGVLPVVGKGLKSGHTFFILQDLVDGLCLLTSSTAISDVAIDGNSAVESDTNNNGFGRCGINAIWYVTGKAGSYQIHARGQDNSEQIDTCLSTSVCNTINSTIASGSCRSCGAKDWNIVGDTELGSVITQSNNKYCIKRVGKQAIIDLCDNNGYTTFKIEFITKDNILKMNSDGTKLINAAIDGDYELVQRYISNDNIDVNCRDWDDVTPLIGAATTTNIEIIKYLITSGAQVNLYDKSNLTALMEACIKGVFDIVEYLINAGADVNMQATSGVNALWLAANSGSHKIVELLLTNHADINNKKYDGQSILHVACEGGHVDIVKLLLDEGISVDEPDQDNITPLIMAAENGSLPIVELLVTNGAKVNLLSKNGGFSPLIVAAAHGHYDVVKYLLEHGAEVDIEHPENLSALMYAAAGGYTDVVKLLLKNKASVNRVHKEGGSALSEAASNGNFTCFQALIDAGADYNVVDSDGIAALHTASAGGHLDIVKLLVNKKVNINLVSDAGATSLYYAASGGHVEVVKQLLLHNPHLDVQVKSSLEYIKKVQSSENNMEELPKEGTTALHSACENGYLEIVELLVQAKCQLNLVDVDGLTPLVTAIMRKHYQIAEYLLTQPGIVADTYYTNDLGKKVHVLIDCIVNNRLEFAVKLIQKGVDISYIDDDGVSVIALAAYKGQKEVVKAILQRMNSKDKSASDEKVDMVKAILNSIKKNDSTLKQPSETTKAGVDNDDAVNPLLAAASEGHVEIVRLLLSDSNYKANSVDKDGTTALMAAAVRGQLEVINVLLNEAEININQQNIDGHTALMFAYNGKNQIATLSKKYNEYMPPNKVNETAVSSIKDSLKKQSELIQVLLRHGADTSVLDHERHQAIDFDFI